MGIKIYGHVNLQRVGTGPELGKTTQKMNYIVHYGAIEISGTNKWNAIENMVRELRRLDKNSDLSEQMSSPANFSEYDQFIIHADLIKQDTSDYIDRDLIEKVA